MQVAQSIYLYVCNSELAQTPRAISCLAKSSRQTNTDEYLIDGELNNTMEKWKKSTWLWPWCWHIGEHYCRMAQSYQPSISESMPQQQRYKLNKVKELVAQV